MFMICSKSQVFKPFLYAVFDIIPFFPINFIKTYFKIITSVTHHNKTAEVQLLYIFLGKKERKGLFFAKTRTIVTNCILK